mmetsp:Transcript_110878/g.353292  ORF Transcript_110878/g.353292 Transcript_110878/m.353292 type:complete len:182 (+) Transcript_110878:98-643(+)
MLAAASGACVALAGVAIWDRSFGARSPLSPQVAGAGSGERKCGGSKSSSSSDAKATPGPTEIAKEAPSPAVPAEFVKSDAERAASAVEIEYCVGCRWMLRAGWTAQELLTTFTESGKPPMVSSVTLIPVVKPEGVFRVRVGGAEVWDRKARGGFPEAKQIKQLVRDVVNPQKDLGHSETKA